MVFEPKKAAILAAGFVLGGAAVAVATSGLGRKACVSLVNKGIRLKESVACSLESMKENMGDIVAEAKEMNGGSCCCGCEEDKQA